MMMLQYVILDNKKEMDALCLTVDAFLGYPKIVTTKEAEVKLHCTYASPIKKFDAEKYAYPITDQNSHLIPTGKERKYDLENWYAEGII